MADDRPERPNRGVLFKNNRKKSAKDPDYTGKLNAGGQEFFVSGWKEMTKNGDTYLYIAVTPKDGRTGQQAASRSTPPDEF